MRERNSRSLLVRSRSSSTGSMRSCSRATWLSTEAHCRTTRAGIEIKMQSFWFNQNFFFFVLKEAAHPLVSSSDVLQRSSSRLAGGGVDLTLVQHAVVQPDYLRVPQPLHPLRHPSHLGEGGQILVLALSG